MVKVSITLPNNAQITFESEEPGVVEQVIKMVLRDLPRDLMGSIGGVDGESVSPQDWVKSTSVVAASSLRTTDAEQSAVPGRHDDPAGPDSPPDPIPQSPVPTDAFIEFCRLASPMGDMRKVVVAAEGARLCLSMDSVDAHDLERLFGLAGWHSPHSFIQTLRNAARSKFRWLERLPGRSGRYTVTDLGRATTLSE